MDFQNDSQTDIPCAAFGNPAFPSPTSFSETVNITHRS